MNKGTSASANSQSLLPRLHQPGLVWTGEQTPCRAWGHPLRPPPSVSLPVTSGSGPLGQAPGPGRLLILSSWPQRLEPLQPDGMLLPSNSFALGKQLGGPSASPAS